MGTLQDALPWASLRGMVWQGLSVEGVSEQKADCEEDLGKCQRCAKALRLE